MATSGAVKGTMANAPVKLVVAQVRFERHPDVAASEFVTKFRGMVGDEYTQIEQARVQQIIAGPLGVVSEAPESGWTLATDDGTKISMLEGSAALEVTQYTSWEKFRSQLDDLLEALETALSPATEQRIGLRYIDELTSPGDSLASWKGCVRDELLGPVLHADFGEAITTIEQKVVFTYRDGSACLLRHGYSADPPLNNHYILDTDVFRSVKGAYSGGNVRAAFDEFHSKAESIFVGCLTPEYFEHLRKGE